jgi:16S rRNA (guanine966-N2)-methyltransferase
MRIIAGKYKGRTLKFPKDRHFRPTQDRVKEALFSIIQQDMPDASFLDLCCGTGGISLEAISRGAKVAVAVDSDTSIIRQNKDILSDEDQSKLKLVTKKVPSFLKVCRGTFDLIFFDPPWGDIDLYSAALKHICDFDILAPGGKLIVEFSKKIDVPFDDFQLSPTIYQYGDTKIGLIEK